MCGLGRWSSNSLHLLPVEQGLLLLPVQRPGFVGPGKNAVSKRRAAKETVPPLNSHVWRPDLHKCGDGL